MMRRAFWFFVGLALSALPILAFADTYTAPLRWFQVAVQASPGPYDTYQAAGVAYCSWRSTPGVAQYIVNSENSVTVWCAGGSGGQAVYRAGYCPTGTLSAGQCINAPACEPDLERDPDTGVCQAPPCQAGTEYSSGYYDYGLQPDSPMVSYACANGCEVTFTGDVPASRRLVGGVYHYFARGSYDRTGTACTSGPSTISDVGALPPVTCGTNQYAGQINGSDVCIDKATGVEVNPNTPKIVPTGTSETTTTANPDGSTTTVTQTCSTPGSCTTVTQTCTAPGSCSSTTMHTGGGSGGSGDGGSYTGDGSPVDPLEDDEDQCQKTPLAAMCQERVKLDAEDSPTQADYTTPNQEVDDAFLEVQTAIESRSWELSELGFVWSPVIPSGSCSAVSVGAEVIDICEGLIKARDLWSWVIGVIASLAIWITGTRAISGAKL